jgi:phosphonoacetaldehyde hydrolase
VQKISGIKAVIFDWAGTTVDHGSLAPALAFVALFRQNGVEISPAEARGPMGMAKRDHIAAIAAIPRVAQLWRQVHSRGLEESDLDAMYRRFIPLQAEILSHHSGVIPGVPEAVADLRERGLKIGSSTGYSHELMEFVLPIARAGGYAADCVICSEDVSAGRPAPWMNFAAAESLGIYPMSSILVVDDTLVGIEAGRNAGAVTVAVTRTGNALGLSLEEVAAIPLAELNTRLSAIAQKFLQAGANFVIESAADVPSLIDVR